MRDIVEVTIVPLQLIPPGHHKWVEPLVLACAVDDLAEREQQCRQHGLEPVAPQRQMARAVERKLVKELARGKFRELRRAM